MKVKIDISLKSGVLDTQGKAIEAAINKNLGYDNVSQVRQGKTIAFDLNDAGEDESKKIIDDICDQFLVNKVIEDYTFEIIK